MLKYAVFQVQSAVLIPKESSPAQLRALAARHEFQYDPRPGYLYVRSRAISSRTNDNYDEFPAEEIAKGYKTFIGKPCFVNHVNDNHRRARGVIIDAVLHRDRLSDGSPDVWVEVLHEVDAINFPKLAQAILAKRIDRTSMGCDVEYSVCSMCGNKATTPAEYCNHIPRLKGKKVLKRNAATGSQEEHLIRETCYGLKFFENSLLVEPPADPTAVFTGVEDHSGLGKAASRQPVAVETPSSLLLSEFTKMAAADLMCNCPGAKKIEPHRNIDHPEWAQQKYDEGKTDAWGHPLHQPYDGHGAWNCNNFNCSEHPQSLYEDGPGPVGMPGWMQHENDPDKDIKHEVGKAFHEQGLTDDAHYLLDQQHQGPSKYSSLTDAFRKMADVVSFPAPERKTGTDPHPYQEGPHGVCTECGWGSSLYQHDPKQIEYWNSDQRQQDQASQKARWDAQASGYGSLNPSIIRSIQDGGDLGSCEHPSHRSSSENIYQSNPNAVPATRLGGGGHPVCDEHAHAFDHLPSAEKILSRDDESRARGEDDAERSQNQQFDDFRRTRMHLASPAPGEHREPSGDPNDADGWATCGQGHRHWGQEGAAGLLIRHQSDAGQTHYLLQHRAPWVDDGDTWGIPAGALKRNETPMQGAQRESIEELGGVPHGLTHVKTHTDDHGNGWAFHTVMMDSPSMWGSSGGKDAAHEVGEGGTGWYTAEQMKSMKLHPGFAKTWPLLHDESEDMGKTASAEDPEQPREPKTISLGPIPDGFKDWLRVRDADTHVQREMNDHAHSRVVDLSDPSDLRSHMVEAHGYNEGDFWRNSHDEDHPALGDAGYDDRPLTHHEVRRLHDWEHGNGIENEHPDYEGGLPGQFIGDSHFHTAMRHEAVGPMHQEDGGSRKDRHKGRETASCRDCGSDIYRVQDHWQHDIDSGAGVPHQAVPADGEIKAKQAAVGDTTTGGLTRFDVPAEEVQSGDYLDIGGKTRVHATSVRDSGVTLAYRVRGSKAPGIRYHDHGEPVKVWRRTAQKTAGGFWDDDDEQEKPDYEQRAKDNPAPKVYPMKTRQKSSSPQHGSTYEQVPPGHPAYDDKNSFHDPSPSEEFHGPYRVIQHPDTGKFHVVDNQDRIAQYGPRKGMDSQASAEERRDYADQRQSSKEKARGMADRLWEGFAQAADPGSTPESRQSTQNMSRMTNLMDRYEGGSHHPLHPGKFDYDDEEHEGDKNGQPYYQVKDPGGSGFTARDYGGPNVHIYHEATPDETHDLIDEGDPELRSKTMDVPKPQGYGHDELHTTLNHWVNGAPHNPKYPDDTDPETGRGYSPAKHIANDDPRIQRWQQRNGYRG